MFILTSLISIGILFSVFLFVLNNKVREMNVYYSLGKSKLKITASYVAKYIISFLPAVIIGMALGVLISFLISQRIVTDNISIQNDLLSYAASGMHIYQPEGSIVLTLDNAAAYKTVSISSVLILMVIAVTVAVACAVILSGNLRRKIS